MVLKREKQTTDRQPTIYFVERISEIKRYVKKCEHLVTPSQVSGCSTLTEALLKLLEQGKSIVTSHALLSNMTTKHWLEVSLHQYKYVIDETITEVRKRLEVSACDIEKLIDDGYLEITEQDDCLYVSVTPKEGYNQHQALLTQIKSGQTKLNGEPSTGDKKSTYELVWGIHPKTFLSAKSIEILTYQSEGSFLHKYLEMLGIEIKKMSVVAGEIVPYRYQNGAVFRELIRVHKGKQNDFAVSRGDSLDSGLTANWYRREQKKKDSKALKKAKAATLSFFRECGAECSQKTFAFTCPKSMVSTVARSEYFNKTLHKKHDAAKAQCKVDFNTEKITYLPQNIRGVNEYGHKQFMAYLCNTYPIFPIQLAFAQEGYPIDKDAYALNQLIQWIFRGCVRNGQPITVFIPNRRMRYMFLNWLGYSEKELF